MKITKKPSPKKTTAKKVTKVAAKKTSKKTLPKTTIDKDAALLDEKKQLELLPLIPHISGEDLSRVLKHVSNARVLKAIEARIKELDRQVEKRQRVNKAINFVFRVGDGIGFVLGLMEEARQRRGKPPVA